MATHGDLQTNVPSGIRKKKIGGQQKREALEREVSVLQNMLKQEEKMHYVLEQIHNKSDFSAVSVPNFFPPKAKELLAELATVESEIARLEGQIVQLQEGLRQEQEVNKAIKSKLRQPASVNNLQGPFSSFVNPSPVRRGVQENMAFDTKALHFISKAIKGDYNLNNDYSLNERMGFPREVPDHQKENQFHEETKFQNRAPRKSGVLSSPSPFRDPTHSTPRLRESYVQNSTDLLSKALSNSILSGENPQLQPNKLSENILKCLNVIYVRLLRTTRAMELEKSGPISRSLHTSLMTRSFRAEVNTNLKSSLMLQRESRQQDPYGIFDVENSIPRDIGPYKNLVIFTSSSMDPKCISTSGSIPLLRKLRALMDNLQTVDLRFLTNQQKLAFWINMYNACIMHGFLQNGVPSSPEKLFTLINTATLNIGGDTIDARAIEHYILRKPSSSKALQKGEKDDKEAIIRKLHGLESTDPNVTFALCCGTRSSPAVRVYTAEGITAELEKSKLEYLQASVVVTSTKRIAFPEILLRNTLDYAMDTHTLVEWACHQLPTSGSLRKSIVDCFRSPNSGKIPTITVEKIPYDYEFQYLLAISTG